VLALGLTGNVNIQGFIDGHIATFIEVNPRFSGGLPLSLASGCDLVGQHLRGIHGLPLEGEKLKYRTGAKMYRYWNEVYEGA
jgi:carbamoyl-phosphate synthase large subunit